MKLVLITCRTLGQGRGAMIGRLGKYYERNAAVLYLAEEDLHSMGIEEGDAVEVSSRWGKAVVRAMRAPEKPPAGTAYMPYGPWASLLMGSETMGTGMPQMKGVVVEAKKATRGEVRSPAEAVRTTQEEP